MAAPISVYVAKIGTGAGAPSAEQVTGTVVSNKVGLDVNLLQSVSVDSDISTLTNVAAATSSTTILALNTSRKGGILVNDSTSICYVKFGSTASSTSFSVEMAGRTASAAAHFFLENIPNHRGIITAIWVTATGSMRVTEFT